MHSLGAALGDADAAAPAAPGLPPIETDASAGLTLENFEQLAVANNPALRAASAAASEAAGVRTQVGLKPNPTVGYFGEEIGNEGSGGLQGAFVSQTFVLGDKLELNRQVLNQDVQRLLWLAEAQRYRVRTDIQQRFYEALAAQRRLELAREFRDVAEKGVRIATERFDALEGARPDILQSEIQLNEIELVIRQAELDYEAAWKELATVAGVPDMQPASLAGTLPTEIQPREFEATYQQLIAKSPELQAALVRVERARANLRRQNVQPIPNVMAQLGVGHDTGTGDEFANIQLGVPLPVFNRNQGNIQAASAEYARASQDARRLKLDLRARLTRALRDYSLAEATVSRYREQILPRSRESLQLAELAYSAGEFDFLRVLTERRTFFDANLEYVQALADLAAADAAIEGLLLTGGLSATPDFQGDDGLRGQALSGQ